MPAYNFTKAADRARCRADRQAELDAALDGTWPRNLDDDLRWVNAPTSPFLSAAENRRVRAEYAAVMCRAEIAYLDGVDRRIAGGDPDLAGWEPAEQDPSVLRVPVDVKCADCGGRVPKGTSARFVQGHGIVHLKCEEGA